MPAHDFQKEKFTLLNWHHATPRFLGGILHVAGFYSCVAARVCEILRFNMNVQQNPKKKKSKSEYFVSLRISFVRNQFNKAPWLNP